MESFEPSPSSPPLPLPPLPPAFDWSQPYFLIDGETGEKRPRVWTVFVTVLVAFVASQLAGGAVPVMATVVQAKGEFASRSDFYNAMLATLGQPKVLLASGIVVQSVLLLTVLCAVLVSPVPLIRRLRLNASSLSLLGYLITPIGALAVSILFSSLIVLAGIHPKGMVKVLTDLIRHLSPAEVIAAVFIVGVMPAFAEEFLFRGYTQTRLVQRWGRWIGISITAVLFGIMHMDPLQGTFAVGFGFYIGYLVEKSGSIRPSMVCHAVNNSAQVLLGWLSPATDQEMSRPAAATVAIVSFAVILLCILYIYFRVRPRDEATELPPGDSFPDLTAVSA